MKFGLDDTQREVIEATRVLLDRMGGVDRAREFEGSVAVDSLTLNALEEAGYLDLFVESGPLEAELVAEQAGRFAVAAPVALRALVAPPILGDQSAGEIVAVGSWESGVPIRYAPVATTILLVGEGQARLVKPEPGQVERLVSPFGYPLGKLTSSDGRALGPDAADTIGRWWRVALAAEAVGCMDAAVRRTIYYVTHRKMFGTTLGSFQAIQHRLSELVIMVRGATWLTRRAAWMNAEAEYAALCAAFAMETAKLVLDECHQFHGATGLTRDDALHVWTMRLQTLRVEAGGVSAHRMTAGAGAR
jgi:hypothetical protein